MFTARSVNKAAGFCFVGTVYFQWIASKCKTKMLTANLPHAFPSLGILLSLFFVYNVPLYCSPVYPAAFAIFPSIKMHVVLTVFHITQDTS